MKIIYIANARIPTEKAHGIQIMKMCEAFADAGSDIKLIVPRRLNNLKENPFKYYGVKENFKIIRLPTLDLVKFGKIGFWIQSISFSKFVTIYCLFKKVDIIYSRDELPLWFLSFFKKNLVLEIHVAKKNFISKKVFKKVKIIIAITKGLQQFYTKEYGTNTNKIHWSPDAVDLEEFKSTSISQEDLRKQYNLPIDKKIIGWIGKLKTMGEGKGAEKLIKAFPQIFKSNQDSFLMIVGTNPSENNEIQDFFKKSEIGVNSYKIINHVSRNEVINYLKMSDLLIMNYPDTEHYAHYMSPMKLFEYMASGNPIVASDLPSIREILNEKNAILVEPDNTEVLAEGINKVLINKSFSEKITQQALIDVQNYTWKKRVKNILDFIKDNDYSVNLAKNARINIEN